jgi:hypothetical protein
MTAQRRPTDRTEDRRAMRLDPDPLHVEPEPVRRMAPGAADPDADERRTGVTVPLLLLGVVITLVAIAWAVAAPREAADPTTSATRDVSGLRDGASGPPLLGAPLAGDGGTTTAPSGAPAPEGDVGSALIGGKATWCAPTPTHCQSWGGGALVGAVPSFSYGDEPYLAEVCSGGACVTVTVVSYCACGDRGGEPTVIDLSPAAFSRLAPLSAGVIDVTMESGGPAALPPTDTDR